MKNSFLVIEMKGIPTLLVNLEQIVSVQIQRMASLSLKIVMTAGPDISIGGSGALELLNLLKQRALYPNGDPVPADVSL